MVGECDRPLWIVGIHVCIRRKYLQEDIREVLRIAVRAHPRFATQPREAQRYLAGIIRKPDYRPGNHMVIGFLLNPRISDTSAAPGTEPGL